MWEDVRCALFLLGRTQNSSSVSKCSISNHHCPEHQHSATEQLKLHAAYALVSRLLCGVRWPTESNTPDNNLF